MNCFVFFLRVGEGGGGGGGVIVSKHLRPKDHKRKINKIHNDFEAYQVFMQIFYVKMLGYSF